MKSNSQVQLSNRLYLADIDGDKIDEFIQVDGRHIYAYRSNFDLYPVLEHVFSSPVRRLIIGDFVKSGREHGKEQICAILDDGSLIAFAISDDLKSLWWWFTQTNFITEDEHSIVGDFDGDGADEVMVYKPSNGTFRFYSITDGAVFKQNFSFSLGNLAGRNLINKEIFAGEFGQKAGRKDLLIVDRSAQQIMRFDTATDATGAKTFWWAFTSNARLFSANDQLCVANIDGSEKDGLIIRDYNTGTYRLFNLELNPDLTLRLASSVNIGQLPIKPRRGKIIATKIRSSAFRGERGGLKRDDIVYFDEPNGELIITDARFDAANSLFTYWWSFTSGLLLEPTVPPQSLPWAVILCRFKGLPPDPNMENLFRQMFTPGSGGLVEYWHDISLGKIDISSSRIFGWVELDITRAEAAGKSRTVLVNKAVEAAKRAGLDPITGFFSQIAVLTHNFSIDNPVSACNNPCIDWSTRCPETDDRYKTDDKCASVWIDGSSDGHLVSAPPHAHSGSFIAHEIAHGYGFDHDLAPDLANPYGDRTCIMSAMGVDSFIHPVWNVPFGPSMSFAQLMINKHNWMYARRVYQENTSWLNNKAGVTFLLAPINDRTANANLGAILPQDAATTWSYYLEYMKPTGWNKGIGNPKFVIRRIFNNQAAYLGEIALPKRLGVKNTWTEPSGNVRFQVERSQNNDRIIKVTATKVK
jgi:hypothetical protein